MARQGLVHQEAGALGGAGLFHKGIKLELSAAPQYQMGQGPDSNRLRGGNIVNQDKGPSRDQPRAAGRGRARCTSGNTLLAASAQGLSRRQSRGRTVGYNLTPVVHLQVEKIHSLARTRGDNTKNASRNKPQLEGQA